MDHSAGSGPAVAAILQSMPRWLEGRRTGRVHSRDFVDAVLGSSSSSRHCYWRLSTRHQIRPGGRSETTALNVSSSGGASAQFLLTGSRHGRVSIYDLWERVGNKSFSNHPRFQHEQQQQCHRPIQQASVGGSSNSSTTTTTIAAVQWYPVDTGIFFTASAAGSVAVWDTNAMVPVLQAKPFQFQYQQQQQQSVNNHNSSSSNIALRCMHVSTTLSHTLLAATGSNGSATVKIVDLKSGAASHSLNASVLFGNKPTNGSGAGGGGVAAVQWSPTHDHILASCCCSGSGTLLWDIRHCTRPLVVLDSAHRPADSSVSNATNLHRDSSPLRISGGIPRGWNQKSAIPHPQPALATNLAFTENGQQLVTVCGTRREIDVWDLYGSDAPMRRLQSFTNASGGKPLCFSAGSLQQQPLLLTSNSPSIRSRRKRSTFIWVANGQDVDAYDMNSDSTLGGRPIATLRGHLGNVRAAVAIPAPRQIISAAEDGLLLVWEQSQLQNIHTAKSGMGKNQNNKRLHDTDTW